MIEKQHYRHRSIRLAEFDYSLPGAYFITVVTHGRACVFGEIGENVMILNEFGNIVKDEWQKTPLIRPTVGLGAFVVMPNHVHAIVHILEEPIISNIVTTHSAPNTVEAYSYTPLPRPNVSETNNVGFYSPSRTVGAFVRGFKGSVTKRINELRALPGAPVWQRNYYEHIIRPDEDYLRIEKYIYDNPLNWLKDEENPFQTR
ncbi:MAG: transposase [Anaerolineaceae bacterium]|nr:transposase [Anaerolineaceae bacterium]